MKNNNQLHSIIKLRHLKTASHNNWEMLSNSQKMVNGIISEAKQLMEKSGSKEAKEQFAIDANSLSTNISDMQKSLDDFHQFVNGTKTIEVESSFKNFTSTLNNAIQQFDRMAAYPSSYFEGEVSNDWKDIWNVIKSNMSTVQGLGESGYIKSLMMKNFSTADVDSLTDKIVKHIPESFSLLEADKYKQEYLQAMKEIEQESNSKDNLWDRFLNVLAGNIPFKQTPEERVMMSRWLDGEKGEL